MCLINCFDPHSTNQDIIVDQIFTTRTVVIASTDTGISTCADDRPDCNILNYSSSLTILHQEIKRECASRDFDSFSVVRTKEAANNSDILQMQAVCE